MKTLNLHVDYIEWQGVKKALKSMDPLSEEEIAKKRAEEALVVLTAVEENDTPKIVEKYVKDIEKITEQIKTKNIVLYPYAHLSKKLGRPVVAIEILKKAEEELKKKGFNVQRAPFGYYKTFEMKVKGHPLAELSREITIKDDESIELTEEERKRILKDLSKSKLDTSKLAGNDHRIIGRKMDLWSFSPAAPGMVFWHDKGLHIKNKLIEFWRELHRKEGYEEISTPQIMDRKLWEVSGHWDKYKENMFTTKYEGRDFAVKPMNCPGGMLVYSTSPKSYKDLPLRVGEIGVVHRLELSGVLSGLFRVIQFTQDDAHIFCTEDQLKDELKKIINLATKVYDIFNLKIDHIELSTRPEKRIGREELWDLAENSLKQILEEENIEHVVNEGDGAFYGPKIDFHVRDSLDRTWQCATIQLDMALPERFNLTYTDKDGNEKRPIMLHRVIYGSIERFIGIVTEQYNGKFPLWMSPNQVKVLTMNENADEYAKKIYDELFEKGYRVELDDRNESIGKKVREASIERFNYIVTIGEKEVKEKKLAVKSRNTEEIEILSLKDFTKKLDEEISLKA